VIVITHIQERKMRFIEIVLISLISPIFANITSPNIEYYLKELHKLETSNKDFSHQSIEIVKKKIDSLSGLNCEYEREKVTKLFTAFTALEKKIVQNAEEIRMMKEMLRSIANPLPDEKAALGMTTINDNKNNSEFRQQEFVLTSASRNKIQIDSSTNLRDESTRIPDCSSPPQPTSYCHEYKILWYYSTVEGRCTRFRRGCEEQVRNSYTSEGQCEEVCVRPGYEGRRACLLPRSPGLCDGVISRWYYDSQENRCRHFIYKGCLGNQNRFQDENTCWQTCGLEKYQSSLYPWIGERRGDKKSGHGILYEPIVSEAESKYTSSNTDTSGTEADGHYPEYKPFGKNKLKLNKKLEGSNKFPNTIPTRNFNDHFTRNEPQESESKDPVSHDLNDSMQILLPQKQKYKEYIDINNSAHSRLPHEHKESPDNVNSEMSKDRSFLTRKEDQVQIRNELQKLSHPSNTYRLNYSEGTAPLSNEKKEWKQIESSDIKYSDTYQQDKIKTRKHYNEMGYNERYKQQDYMFGKLLNKNSRSRKYRYVYNDHKKRRSRISKSQNLKVELIAPAEIKSEKPFKMKCIVRGSLVEAVDIIWSKDEDVGTKWKKRESISKSNKKSSTLEVPGINSPIRVTCLVACYDSQAARMLPTQLWPRERQERVMSYLCAWDSVMLSPRGQ